MKKCWQIFFYFILDYCCYYSVFVLLLLLKQRNMGLWLLRFGKKHVLYLKMTYTACTCLRCLLFTNDFRFEHLSFHVCVVYSHSVCLLHIFSPLIWTSTQVFFLNFFLWVFIFQWNWNELKKLEENKSSKKQQFSY